MAGSFVTNCHFDEICPDGAAPLFTFVGQGKGDAVVRLNGLYITDIRYGGVKGQLRLWALHGVRRLRWQAHKTLRDMYLRCCEEGEK